MENNLQITTSGLHCEQIVKYDNWCIDSSLCDKSTKTGTNDCLLSTHCQSKMSATKFSFLTFPHQTAVISCASSRSPCFFSILIQLYNLQHSLLFAKSMLILISLFKLNGIFYVPSRFFLFSFSFEKFMAELNVLILQFSDFLCL